MPKFEDAVVISGIGQSAVGRRLGRSPLALTVDAVAAAIADAGLSAGDVKGLATYPGGGTALGPGLAGPTLPAVYDALGLELDYLMGNYEGPAQLGPFLNGCMAVATGLVRHLVVYRTVTEGSSRAEAKRNMAELRAPAGWSPWITAFGGGPAPIQNALLARRHFHEYGTTREQLGQIALTARKHAGLNPKAVFREPLNLDDYLSARMISDPLCLLDCDIHCDGSTAMVLSRAEYAPDAPNPAVAIDAIGGAPAIPGELAQHVDLRAGTRAAAQMWARTDLRPADVDVAGVYDGFSILTMLWLEALGFCGRGESGPFVDGGARISLGGELPINTNGGQLSGGRLHGHGFIHEMCLQLRGEAGARQVPGARVAVTSMGAYPYVGCMLLRSAA